MEDAGDPRFLVLAGDINSWLRIGALGYQQTGRGTSLCHYGAWTHASEQWYQAEVHPKRIELHYWRNLRQYSSSPWTGYWQVSELYTQSDHKVIMFEIATRGGKLSWRYQLHSSRARGVSIKMLSSPWRIAKSIMNWEDIATHLYSGEQKTFQSNTTNAIVSGNRLVLLEI